MHDLLKKFGLLNDRLKENSKKHQYLLAFLTVVFFLSIGYVYGFERLFFGVAIIVALTFWGGLVFAFAHDFQLNWKAMVLIMIVWMMFILGRAEHNSYSKEECLQSFDLRGSYCE